MALRLTMPACALVFLTFISSAAFAGHVLEGFYALTATTQGGTCTADELLPPFSYLQFQEQDSRFVYLGAPGMQAETVSVPTPHGRIPRWHGKMIWTVNPFTFSPPSVTTSFDVTFTARTNDFLLFNGEFTVPTSSGGTCTEIVGYTASLHPIKDWRNHDIRNG